MRMFFPPQVSIAARALSLIRVQSIHLLITTSKGRLEPVYPALFDIIKNVAPYAKNLQRATSSKVMNLFDIVSAPGFCLRNESNHLILKKVLDACNAILDNHARGKFTSFSSPALSVTPSYALPARSASASNLRGWTWR